MNISECIKKGFLRKTESDSELSKKEMYESTYDLERAKDAFKNNDFKWSIIKCYYSMFHAAKANLFQLGYIEKRHIAIIVVLEELNKQGKLESRYVTAFKGAISAREQADYHYSYSKEIAEFEIKTTEEFLNTMIKLLKRLE